MLRSGDEPIKELFKAIEARDNAQVEGLQLKKSIKDLTDQIAILDIQIQSTISGSRDSDIEIRKLSAQYGVLKSERDKVDNDKAALNSDRGKTALDTTREIDGAMLQQLKELDKKDEELTEQMHIVQEKIAEREKALAKPLIDKKDRLKDDVGDLEDKISKLPTNLTQVKVLLENARHALEKMIYKSTKLPPILNQENLIKLFTEYPTLLTTLADNIMIIRELKSNPVRYNEFLKDLEEKASNDLILLSVLGKLNSDTKTLEQANMMFRAESRLRLYLPTNLRQEDTFNRQVPQQYKLIYEIYQDMRSWKNIYNEYMENQARVTNMERKIESMQEEIRRLSDSRKLLLKRLPNGYENQLYALNNEIDKINAGIKNLNAPLSDLKKQSEDTKTRLTQHLNKIIERIDQELDKPKNAGLHKPHFWNRNSPKSLLMTVRNSIVSLITTLSPEKKITARRENEKYAFRP